MAGRPAPAEGRDRRRRDREAAHIARVFVNDEQVDDLSTVIEVQEPSTEVSLLLLPASQGG
ncbi:MAG: hypothetical protein HYY85_09645 [Deltaproteobacteria bacterium]|nr:hypothetical protein [Deltaproteobacteria bacterium]